MAAGQNGQAHATMVADDHASTMHGLRLENLSVRYGTRIALEQVSMTLSRGEMVALVGPNGAGKSSLLKAVAGVVPHDGQVNWNGRPLHTQTPRQRARILAYLPQSPAAHWPLRVHDLVALGRLPHRRVGVALTHEDSQSIAWAMDRTEVGELADRHMDGLSGGERSRVLLARALAVQAPVLLTDEPVASLDPYHQLKIMAVLAECAHRGGLVIAVLHDLALAARFATRMIMISEGCLRGDGPPEQVLNDDALQQHYRVRSYVARHENEPVILPWRTIR
jgi:iron complex transport system ATP-binding protein